MSQRDISSTIEDIYGFKVSHEMISDITDTILPESRRMEKPTFKEVLCLCFYRLSICNTKK